MSHALRRYTSADLELMPDDGKRYEIIDGELYVSKAPSVGHQLTCYELGWDLGQWNRTARLGLVVPGPGIIFADDDDVIPDLIWISHQRLAVTLESDGHFHAAPELVVEVLSPGASNEKRDREAKLMLYSRRGVREYWIVDWQRRQIEVYRRVDAALALAATLLEGDSLESPLLPGFALTLGDLFARIPLTPVD
jgi:Uma2 family endonuclease